MPPIPARPSVSGNLAYLWTFSAISRPTFVRCVLACTSPVAVRLQHGARPQEGEGRLRTIRRWERPLAPVPDFDARGLERDSASRSVYRYSPSRHRGSSTHLSHLPLDPLGCVSQAPAEAGSRGPRWLSLTRRHAAVHLQRRSADIRGFVRA